MSRKVERQRPEGRSKEALPLLGEPVTRRGFLKAATLGTAALYLTQLGCRGGTEGIHRVLEQDFPYGDWTDIYYRQK